MPSSKKAQNEMIEYNIPQIAIGEHDTSGVGGRIAGGHKLNALQRDERVVRGAPEAAALGNLGGKTEQKEGVDLKNH